MTTTGDERRLHDAIDGLMPGLSRPAAERWFKIPSPIGDESAAQLEVARVMRGIGSVLMSSTSIRGTGETSLASSHRHVPIDDVHVWLGR